MNKTKKVRYAQKIGVSYTLIKMYTTCVADKTIKPLLRISSIPYNFIKINMEVTTNATTIFYTHLLDDKSREEVAKAVAFVQNEVA